MLAINIALTLKPGNFTATNIPWSTVYNHFIFIAGSPNTRTVSPIDGASAGFMAEQMVGLITENRPVLALDSETNEHIREEFYFEQVQH
jgi:hypothetical protein